MPELTDLLNELAALLGGQTSKAADTAPVDPYAEIKAANQHLRETAKWTLASFAAVGAILVGGLQLSSLGKLTSDTAGTRGLAAIAGVAVAALGVVLAIGFMSSVLEPFLNSFRTADGHKDVTDRVLGDRELVGKTYEELRAKIAEKDEALARAQAEHGASSTEYTRARASRDAWEDSKQAALAVIGSELLWERYKKARRAVVAAVFLVLGGVVAFAWGANPPSEAAKGPAVVLAQAPLLLDVTLTPRGIAALKDKRGCADATLTVLSISGDEGKREVVAIPTATCKTVRFVLVPSLGTPTAAA